MMGWRLALLSLVQAVQCAAAVAQTTVYESKDRAGPVYSDKPSPGASAVELPPPNVIQSPKIDPIAPPPPTAVVAYRSLTILSLADKGSVHTNTGAFSFSARAVPALRPGDRIRIRLDGRLLPTAFRTGSLHIGQSDWQGAATPDTAEHSLQLVILGPRGAVLVESAPVSFYVHRATVAGRR